MKRIALTISWILVSHVQAATVVSNLTEGAGGGWSAGWDKAVSFTSGTDAATVSIYSASIRVLRSYDALNIPSSSSFEVGIWSSAGNLPSSKISSFTYFDYTAATDIMRFSTASAIVLSPSTQYFFVIDDKVDNGGLATDGTFSTAETGLTGWNIAPTGGADTYYRSATSTGGWSQTSPLVPFALSTDVLSTTPIPEPTGALTLAGLLGGAAFLRRRRA